MNIPAELKYSKTHEWVKIEGENAYVGITDYAQDALGDLVFVNLPEVGVEVIAGEEFTDVESVKASSDIIAPVSGVICETNDKLLDAPEAINEAPYEAWIVMLENISIPDELMSAEEYEEFIATLD